MFLIDNCQIKLENEESFVVDVKHLIFVNSAVNSMNTVSFKADVRIKVKSQDSIFEHCQEKVSVRYDTDKRLNNHNEEDHCDDRENLKTTKQLQLQIVFR